VVVDANKKKTVDTPAGPKALPVYENPELFRRVWGEEWPTVRSGPPALGCDFYSRGG
jgi:hypothetical protein